LPHRTCSVLLLAAATLVLAGCQVDTETLTEVAADGSVTRIYSMQLKDLDREKEATTYPFKRFVLPNANDWKIEEDKDAQFRARCERKAGQPIPGGYERHLRILDRRARNAVKVEVRDHVIATAYAFEERYTDTVAAAEFHPNMMSEFDRVMGGVAAAIEKEFGASHDTAPARKYIEKDLRRLYDECIQEVHRGGIWTAVGTGVFRMAFGGFPIKKVDQVMNADPREIVKALIAHCLNKAQLRKDAENEQDEQAHAELVKTLTSGTVDEQIAARRKIEATGPLFMLRLESALKDAAPKSGAATRLEETIKAVREATEARRTALIARLTKQLEDDFLRPPADKKEETEKKLAQMLGVNIEANFASVEYMFLVRLKLPGEVAWVDDTGVKLRDGTVRWNFNAVTFFHKPQVCAARSRVWKEDNLKALGQALGGDPASVTLKIRAAIDDELAKLDAEGLKQTAAALNASIEAKGKAPLEELAAGTAGQPANQCARAILELFKK